MLHLEQNTKRSRSDLSDSAAVASTRPGQIAIDGCILFGIATWALGGPIIASRTWALAGPIIASKAVAAAACARLTRHRAVPHLDFRSARRFVLNELLSRRQGILRVTIEQNVQRHSRGIGGRPRWRLVVVNRRMRHQSGATQHCEGRGDHNFVVARAMELHIADPCTWRQRKEKGRDPIQPLSAPRDRDLALGT